ncbi:MAG TPA: UDP-N-acetylglucosamine 2-epimerase (non-hydrolyzing) [Myxococcales bacterium]|jgi:UDP-N-acetylglucosamine 2-epimerase (non-hydrolysing)
MPAPHRILVALGTRPEVIKLAPLVRALRERSGPFEVVVCATAQHRQMLDQALEVFDLRPDVDLNLMEPGQDVSDLTARVLLAMRQVLLERAPDLVVVQGDTTTAFAVALAAFYARRKVAHVEAGLRSGDKFQPFPEEMNRVMASALTDFHFAPTAGARDNLLKAGHPAERILLTGNTVIDALYQALPRARALQGVAGLRLDPARRLVLVTGHRRESFGPGIEAICAALRELATARPDVEIVYPVHLNPQVRGPVHERLSGLERLHLIEPQPYLPFLWLMDRAHLLLTDSGGVQEEGPALGKPVLVMREVTERPEAVAAGAALLVGTDRERIVSSVVRLLDDAEHYRRMSTAGSPYGDGRASQRIAEFLEKQL